MIHPRDLLHHGRQALFCSARNRHALAEVPSRFTPEARFLHIPENEELMRCVHLAGGVNQLREEFEAILAGRFTFLGRSVDFDGYHLDWNLDPQSGFRWPRRYAFLQNIYRTPKGTDVKAPWELSRCHHFICLGLSHRVLEDSRAAECFRVHVQDWLQQNPVARSVHWRSAMEVAIRSVNWIVAGEFFHDSLKDEPFWKSFYGNLLFSARYIRSNLENREADRNNHYLSNLCGLLVLSLLFDDPGLSDRLQEEARSGYDFAQRELECELERQVLPDGMSYEMAPAYQRLDCEMLLYTQLLCRNAGARLSDRITSKIRDMLRALSTLAQDGPLPGFSDADDGRFLVFRDWRNWPRDRCSWLERSSRLAHGICFSSGGDSAAVESLLLGLETQPWEGRPPKGVGPDPAGLPLSGFFRLASGDLAVWVRCGAVGVNGKGTHAHNDQLSFELYYKGEKQLVDPGTGCYTCDPDVRERYRSTAAHNTLRIHGLEQSPLDRSRPFRLEERCRPRCIRHTPSEFAGEHEGFHSESGFRHERLLRLDSGGLTVEDRLSGEGDPPIAHIGFLFDASAGRNSRDEGNELRMVLQERAVTVKGAAAIESATWSPSYGVFVPGCRVQAQMRESLCTRIEVVP